MITHSTWKAIVQREHWADRVLVWLVNREGGVSRNATIGKDGVLELTGVKEGEPMSEPLLRISISAWQEIVNAISEEVPLIKKEIVDAELKASKYHLEDMRKIVFKEQMNG